MGIDVRLYFEAKGDISSLYLPSDFEIEEAPDFVKEGTPGATHRVSTMLRYYGPYYERGNWPAICWVLMELHAHENVGEVWYGGDTTIEIPECPPEEVVAISLHYMQHGNRPYLNAFK